MQKIKLYFKNYLKINGRFFAFSFIFFIFSITCSSPQKKAPPPVKKTQPAPTVVKKRSYPRPSATAKKRDSKGCQIYKNENFPSANGKQDGRYTLGVKNQRIMYGYPMPISTSHFVIKVNGLYASNANVFGCKAEYILSSGDEKERKFTFHGLEITQKLIPVTRKLQPTNDEKSTQYYRIEYNIENKMEYPQKVSFLLLVDTMIDDNDAAKFYYNKRLIHSERHLRGEKIPENLLVFQRGRNFNKLVGEFLIRPEGTSPADELYIGRWPQFHRTLWNVYVNRRRYSDSAVFMRWREQELAANASREMSTYYGLYKNSNGGLRLRYNHTSGKRETATLYFANKSSYLGRRQRQRIQKIINEKLANKKVYGISITAHSDAKGKFGDNYRLSYRRARSVYRHLRRKLKKVNKNAYILKYLGESMATNTRYTRRRGYQKDRKAEVVFYID